MNTLLEKIAVDVTAEQVGRCSKIWGPKGEDFFLVANSRDLTDDNGDIIEYEVRYDSTKGFTCSCPSGQFGFAHCKNFCWHVRAACACELEMRGAIAEMAEKIEADRGEGRATHALALPAVMSIEQKWNLPKWMLEGPVAPSMKKSPKELN